MVLRFFMKLFVDITTFQNRSILQIRLSAPAKWGDARSLVSIVAICNLGHVAIRDIWDCKYQFQ
jgi:hypothetical protein